MEANAKKLRLGADLADQIARSSIDLTKRQLYEHLAAHFSRLAGEIEEAMAKY